MKSKACDPNFCSIMGTMMKMKRREQSSWTVMRMMMMMMMMMMSQLLCQDQNIVLNRFTYNSFFFFNTPICYNLRISSTL